MCRKLIYLISCMLAIVTTSANADKLSGLADVTVVDDAIVSLRYAGTEYVVADGDLVLGTTTRWYIDAGVEVLWPEGDPVPAATPTVAGTSNPKAGDVGSKADNFLFRLGGGNDISSIDGIDFQQTIFPFLTNIFFHFERGGNDTGTWQAILADGSLGVPVAFSGGTDYADTGVNVGGQNAYGVVFTTDVPVQGVRITASGHDTLSISTPKPLPVLASIPNPPDGATDVPRDVVLSWTPGIYAPAVNGHKVFFSENFNDVNEGIGGITQSASSYAVPQRLDFNKTYYWRVDEVNGPPSFTVYPGDVWQFTTEPFAYPIAGTSITATASSQFRQDTGPENTINGSGLDENDLHSTEEAGIWVSSMTGPQPTWIQYEFDRIYKLHQMWVWNFNQAVEPIVGLGFKEVTIEYSTNGADWAALADVPEFARAPGTAGYAANTTIDLSGVVARYVKITANSNWGGLVSQYGLSEVCFFHIPVIAREPAPASGKTDMGVDNVTLSWRAGREAASHNLYFSTDEQAVIDETISPVSISADRSLASYDTGELELGQSYYWKVNEVNEAETPTTWQGNVWSFSTQEYLVVDDIEDYNDFEPDRVFDTWIDCWGDPANGSQIGYAAPTFVETTIVHGGSQSMPLIYDNSTASYSEATANVANLRVGQDWTRYGIQTLVLYFHGNSGNTGQLYVKLNNSKVVYDGDAADIATPRWNQWYIDLALPGVNLQNVTTLSIGIDGNGASGTLYFDDIRLYADSALQPVITISPIDSLEADLDPADPTTLLSARAINGHPVSELVLGTTTADFEKWPAHPAADADNFDLTTYASLDEANVVKTVFEVPVTTIFILERGANDSGYFQPIDAQGNPIGGMLTFTAADFQFQDTGLRIVNQTAGGTKIEAKVPINGLLILPPDDGVLGIDPASISAIPAQ